MEKRVRSPNYPAISLRDALEKTSALYKNLHTHAGPREVIVKAMGYASLNGSSMSAISALHKYGLLEGRGDEIKISDRAMRILHPETKDERALAIKEAASDPALFVELDDRFPGAVPNEDLLRNYLLRRNFASGAVSQVILSYRETKEFVKAESGDCDSPISTTEGPVSMHPQIGTTQEKSSALTQITQQKQSDDRLIVHYLFEGGGSIRIFVEGNISTEEAMDMAEIQIGLKRKEIERRKKASSVVEVLEKDIAESDEENEYNV